MASDKTDSYIPFFGRDFLAATMGWPDAAVGAYIRLLIVQWEQGGLPEDLDELAAIAHTVAANWRKLESKFPVDEDGQRRNRRLEEHRAKAGQLAASRKAKAEAAARARWDAPSNAPSNAPSIAQAMPHTCPPSPSPSPRELNTHTSCVATSVPPKRRTRSQPADPIRWTPAAGWEGITPEDRAAWGVAYPACDIPGELARMAEWLRANPAKAHKSRWRAFVTSWLTRSQDKGGGKPSHRPGDAAPVTPWAERASWRGDAGANMTESRYRAWRAAQRPTQAALDIAGRLSVPAGDNG